MLVSGVRASMKINKMPDKETLEEFLDGGHDNHPTSVYFDTEKGEFIHANGNYSLKDREVSQTDN